MEPLNIQFKRAGEKGISETAQALYHLLEHLDGERKIALIPYKTAQKCKMVLLQYI